MCSCSGGSSIDFGDLSRSNVARLFDACESIRLGDSVSGYNCKYPLPVLCALIYDLRLLRDVDVIAGAPSSLNPVENLILGLVYPSYLVWSNNKRDESTKNVLHSYFLERLGINIDTLRELLNRLYKL